MSWSDGKFWWWRLEAQRVNWKLSAVKSLWNLQLRSCPEVHGVLWNRGVILVQIEPPLSCKARLTSCKVAFPSSAAFTLSITAMAISKTCRNSQTRRNNGKDAAETCMSWLLRVGSNHVWYCMFMFCHSATICNWRSEHSHSFFYSIREDLISLQSTKFLCPPVLRISTYCTRLGPSNGIPSMQLHWLWQLKILDEIEGTKSLSWNLPSQINPLDSSSIFGWHPGQGATTQGCAHLVLDASRYKKTFAASGQNWAGECLNNPVKHVKHMVGSGRQISFHLILKYMPLITSQSHQIHQIDSMQHQVTQ